MKKPGKVNQQMRKSRNPGFIKSFQSEADPCSFPFLVFLTWWIVFPGIFIEFSCISCFSCLLVWADWSLTDLTQLVMDSWFTWCGEWLFLVFSLSFPAFPGFPAFWSPSLVTWVSPGSLAWLPRPDPAFCCWLTGLWLASDWPLTGLTQLVMDSWFSWCVGWLFKVFSVCFPAFPVFFQVRPAKGAQT